MNCQQWELRLAGEDRAPDVDAHLAQCASCRALADELAANTAAMADLLHEPMPAVVIAGPEPRPGIAWPRRGTWSRPGFWTWPVAAAAAAVLAIFVVRAPDAGTSTEPAPRVAPVMPSAQVPAEPPPIPARPAPHARPPAVAQPAQPQPAEPLLVKMLTTDPDVVIYWLIESDKGDGLI